MSFLQSKWPNTKGRRLFREVNERGHDLPLASVTKDGGVEFRADLDISVWNPADEPVNYKRVLPGDFVIGLRSFQSGLGYSAVEGLVSPAYTVLRPTRPLVGSYYKLLFKSSWFISLLNNVSQGIRQGKAISANSFYDLVLPDPPAAIQEAIASYLDRATALIDALIDKKQRIRTLSEDRLLTLISQATHARWASAYVEDPLPGGWQLLPLRRCLASSTYGIGEPSQPEGAIGVLGMANVDSREIVGAPSGYVMEVDPALLLRPGDLLFNRTNSRELVGKVALVRKLIEPLTFASYLVRLRVGVGVDATYLNFLLNSRDVLSVARSLALPSIGQANLNPRRYAAIRIPLPTLDVQSAIARELESECATVSSAFAGLDMQINLLQERRRALITAAVTGQLDLPEAA